MRKGWDWGPHLPFCCYLLKFDIITVKWMVRMNRIQIRCIGDRCIETY